MNKTEESLFFSLLRSSLWNEEVNTALFIGEWKWKCILQVYESHALVGVVANVIMSLPESYIPSIEQRQRVIRYVASLLQAHHDINRVICTSFSLLKDSGINPILLKGQGLAAFYPETNSRSIGDIDVYVEAGSYEHACQVIRDYLGEGFIVEDINDRLHYHIEKNGLIFEIHRKCLETSVPSKDKIFNQWASEQLSDCCEEICLPSLDKEASTIKIPGIEYNLVFVFDHLCKHFSGIGGHSIGLRQFCDIAILLHHYREKVVQPLFQDQLRRNLKRFGIFRPWQVFGGIIVDYLGLPEAEYPFYDARLARKAHGAVLQYIVEGGNFGKNLQSFDYAERNLLGYFKAISFNLKQQIPLYRVSFGIGWRYTIQYLRDGFIRFFS